MKPVIFIILDGAGDLPDCPDYHISPLESAQTPNLDNLARNGHAGLLYPIEPGVEPETHSGMLNLFGYQVLPSAVPRGPIEALGCGLRVEDGDLVLRVNFGTCDESTGLISDRRVCRTLSIQEAQTLCRDMVAHLGKGRPEYEFDLRVVRNYRACAVIHSRDFPLSDAISNTDPGYPTEGQRYVSSGGFPPVLCRPLEDTEPARLTADIVNDFVARTEEFLHNHKINQQRRIEGQPLANAILTRGPGSSLPKLENISIKLGVKVRLLADLPIELGVGILIGCDCLTYDATEDRQETYRTFVERISSLVTDDAITVIHVKGPDEYGHDGDFLGKVRCLEDIDRYLIEPLTHMFRDDSVFVVTSDHATPCYVRAHTADPVPFIFAGSSVKGNGATRVTERDCRRLKSPVSRGSQVLAFAIGLANN